jgi:hypothetical protein
MADLARLEAALRKADKLAQAGDARAAADAKKIADAIRAQRGLGGVPAGMTLDPISGQYRNAEMRARYAADTGRDGGTVGRVGRAVQSGVGFGLGDEFNAGMAAVSDAITGRAAFGDAYTSRLADERAIMENFRKDRPALAYGTEIAASMLVPGAATKAGATVAQNAVRLGAVGALQGGAYGFGSGEGIEGRMTNAAVGSVIGGATGAAIPYAMRGAEGIAARRATDRAVRTTAANAPTDDMLRAEAETIYRGIRGRGVRVKPTVFEQFAQTTAADLANAGIDPTLTPGATAALGRLTSLADTGATSWDDLERARRIAGIALKGVDPKFADDRRLAGVITDKIDDFVLNLVDGDLDAGTAANLSGELKEARALWKQLRGSERLGGAIEKAKDAASGFENGLRIEFRKIVNDKRLFRTLSKAEQDAIRAVVRGTPAGNVLKRVSRLSFGTGAQTNFLGASVGSGAAAAAGGAMLGPVGAGVAAVAAPLLGRAAGNAAEATTLRAAERARGLVAAGGLAGTTSPTNLLAFENALARLGRAPAVAAVNALSLGQQ